MARIGPLALLCAVTLLSAPPACAQPGKRQEATIESYLLAQTALLQGEMYLLQRQPARAVEVLEAQLPNINVNRRYLQALRDAYRTYLNELAVNNDPKGLADLYRRRLLILENDVAGGGKPVAAAPAQPVLAGAQPAPVPAAAPAPTVARGKVDPFDLTNRQPTLKGGPQGKGAEGLLAQAEEKYTQQRWAEARALYEQAHRTDERATEGCRDRWAYCKMQHVVQQINNTGAQGGSWTELEQEVRQAIALSPKLAKTGEWLLGEIGRRGGARPQPASAPAGSVEVAVRHQQRTGDGWQVAETRHFRIFHTQSREFAEKVARVAEQARVEVSRKWFANEGEEWSPRCDVYLHATAQQYSKQTGIRADSPGHSRIELDPSAGRVASRRIEVHCENPEALLSHVLPHETTHVVLAGQFGGQRLPRWADEGMAVLTEPPQRVEKFRRELARCHRQRELFEVRELLQMEDYPHPRRINAFYAQSVGLVDYLARLKGPRVFAQFLRDSLRRGYEPALRAHYQIEGFADLQTRWGQQVAAQASSEESSYAGR
ncbi:MAG: hypothetical protein L0Z62_36760 [Gemmataceae bacterium]|nr:hypothetical protein [Gemmataceae bacterium]